MPNPGDNDSSTVVNLALDRLEYYGLNNHLNRMQDYYTIQTAFEKGENLSSEQIEKLLAVCIHDLREDMKYTAIIMNIIPAILSRVQMGKYDPCPNLLASALAVLHIIKTTANMHKAESLKTLCYDTLLSYPDDVLIALAEQHEEVMELFNLYLHMRIPCNIRLKTYNILHKLLKILPPENKRVFIEKGVQVWFAKIIPTIMTHVSIVKCDCDKVIQLLELLTDELVKCDYTENSQYQNLLECICSSQKYPAVMINLLQDGSEFWHRLWIVFIRLLKNQITQSLGSIGTPINSMLPVVEAAFKLDVNNRCKAFECWNVLIDSFSTETNESNINKRFKLLIIPLKSNNAKAEATALAKFKCWWHLIQKFQNKIDKFMDTVLVSFLHFCFGKHNATDRSALVPGQMSMTLKKLCIQALVDMVGHVHCDGCTELPKLKEKMINTKNLVDNWNHWIFSLTSSIMMSATTDDGLTTQQMTCLWKSFLLTIGELPENNIRKDLFSEMLSILSHLVQQCNSNSKLADLVFNALLLSLFDGDERIKQLLKTRNDTNDPLYKVFSVLLDPLLSRAYLSYNNTELVTKLKPLTDITVDPGLSLPSNVIAYLLKTLPINNMGVSIWIALVESICESKNELCGKTLSFVMVWPLKSIKSCIEIKSLAMTWYKTYDLHHEKLKECDTFKNALLKFLFSTQHVNQSSVYFKLSVTLSVIKSRLAKGNCTACEKELELLHNLTDQIDSYQSFDELVPILFDRVVAAVMIVISNINENITSHILLCAKKMLTVMTQACNQLTDVSHILPLIGRLLNSLDVLFKVELYFKLIPLIVDDVLDCSSFLSKQPLTKGVLLCLLKTFASRIVETDITFKKIKAIIDKMENNTLDKETETPEKKEFTTPKAKEVPKRTKKKEPSIVNTVTENGEEYVVVKSNWKFNPRKLTENQKEKLQRKREDIPALYQDLSQSQDEFKFVSWKTDSQDTSNSSKSESKSTKTGDIETDKEILSTLPSSDVVPKILENFFSENIKKESTNISTDSVSKDSHVNKVAATPAVTPKNTKSPRMALKDRVFRNVRNLIEKSGMQKENKDVSEDLNKTDNIIKTPVQTKSNEVATVVNSAPPLLSADRPSRVKRKPKKFDELQLLLSAKKKRQSLQNLKADNKSGKSDSITILPKSDTNTDPSIIQEVSSPTVSVTTDDKLNNLDNVKAAKKPNTCDSSEDIQIKEALPKKSSENTNISVEIIEAQTILDQDKDKTIINLDLDSCKDVHKDLDKNNEQSNDMEVETCNTNKDESGNKKDEQFVKCDLLTEMSKNNENETFKDALEQEVNAALNPNLKENNDNVIDVSLDESSEKTHEISNEELVSPNTKESKEMSTPQQVTKKGTEEQKSTTKKPKKSRIEKELAIDMVEGHPFLKMQSERRLTRKAVESTGVGRRKSLVDKLNKSKSETNSLVKSDKKIKEKLKESDSTNSSITVDESQEKDTEVKDCNSVEDMSNSDDVIESSQDSTITTISVKSAKKSAKKVPVVALQKIMINMNKSEDINESQSILDHVVVGTTEASKVNQETKEDIELPLNKTAFDEETVGDLTENMDTEPIGDKELSSDIVIVINDDIPAPLTISSDEPEVGPETQELAEADTQPNDPKDFMDIDEHKIVDKDVNLAEVTTIDICTEQDKVESLNKEKSVSEKSIHPSENNTITLSESACAELEKDGASSPSSFRDEAKRKQDFLNNTLEISPIKNMSPERTKKSPSPDSSSEYVVIKLSSPVNSNGEPFEKCGSPEVFTEDKVSPDKRDQSPPRVEITVSNTSPSSSLSLKKNRPQVRSGGRAAQMLGLCVPDKLQTITNPEKIDTDEINKKTSASSTPARRNLRILYNSVNENAEPNSTSSENDDSENFLKFRRSLPTVDSSPSGPILKRKFIEIDDVTMSPASKRKRVSFHDPPVSTTISVQKYIEPGGVRSPQNSAHKRLERQLRQHTPLKSPKRLDHAFKLDTVLTKAIESFSETEANSTPDDTQAFSLDETPVVEIVRASELNDTDPICPDLVDCTDPIDNIAGELSSNAMKSLLVKELVGKIETVGDLAKMTELEVNRLCIKAPKVKVAKKVLSDYASKRVEKPSCDAIVSIDEAVFDEPMPEPEAKGVEIEVQTDRHNCNEMEVQTDETPLTAIAVQTDTTPTAHIAVQTDETGSKSTADIVKLCLEERPDFVEHVSMQLEENSIQQITDKLSFNAITDVLMKKIDSSNAESLLNRILEVQCSDSPAGSSRSKELSLIRDYMSARFDSKDLLMFCSDVLKSVCDKPTFP